MKTTAALGVGVGVFAALVAFPFAAILGAISVAFHRGHDPDTFGHGIAWACRGAFYVLAASFVAGVLVAWAWMFPQAMALGFLLTLALAFAWLLDRSSAPENGGGVL